MNKLKELAYKQLQSGFSKIDYQEIVRYVKDADGYFAEQVAC